MTSLPKKVCSSHPTMWSDSTVAQAGQTSNVAASNNAQTASGATQASTQTPSQATTSGGLDINAAASGDFSAIAGTWTNDLGDSVTISANGSVTATSLTGTYQISSNGVTGNAFFGTVYNPNESAGSANITVIPANVANPRTGGVTSQDSLTMGQDASADDHPYYRI